MRRKAPALPWLLLAFLLAFGCSDPLWLEKPTPTPVPALTGTRVPVPARAITAGNAARLALLAQWGDGDPECIVYSPDGEDLVLATSIGIYIFDAHTLEQRQFRPTDFNIHRVAISPDGRLLALDSEDGTLWLWDYPSLADTWSIRKFTYYVDAIAFSPDGKYLAMGSDNQDNVYLLDIDRRTVAAEMDSRMGTDQAVFSPDGSLLITAVDYGVIEIWRVPEGARAAEIEAPQNLGDIAISPDGSLLAANAEEEILLWDISSQRTVRTIRGHSGSVTSLQFSPDGKYLASGDWDARILLWETETWKVASVLEGHRRAVSDLAFSPDGSTVTSISRDNSLRQWNVADGTSVGIRDGFSSYIEQFKFSPDGTMIASVSTDSVITVRNIHDGSIRHRLPWETHYLSALSVTPAGLLAVDSAEGFRMWNWGDGGLAKSIPTESRHSLLDFLSDREAFVLINEDDHYAVALIEIDGGRMIREYPISPGSIFFAAVSSDGRFLAVVGPDSLYMYSVSDGKRVYASGEWIGFSLAFSPDGRFFVTSRKRIYRVDDGEQIGDFDDRSSTRISAISFSPDGTVFAASEEERVKFWSFPDADLLLSVKVNSSTNGFSPDGRYFVTGGDDGLLKLWGVVE